MSAMRKPRTFTFDEYLLIERDAPYKSEYLDGMIYAMSGGTGNHSFIAVNASTILSNLLRGKGCRVGNSDLMVATVDQSFSAYPDVTVVCGSPIYANAGEDVLVNPLVIVEVLSPSTESYDRGEKFEQYKQIDSLIDYLLISQDSPIIELWHKDGGKWTRSTMSGLESQMDIPSLGIRLPLSGVYEGIFEA
jgi:Uma2 family endonuclease